MSKRTKLYLTAIALLGLFVVASCRKEPKTTLIFGDNTDMEFITFSEEDAKYHSGPNEYYWYYSVDVNGDNEEDICFRWEDIASPELGSDVISTVMCTNDHIALLGELYDYSIYYNMSVNERLTEDGIFVSETLYSYSCQPTTDTDSIVETHEELNLYDKNEGENLSINDSFYSMNVRLRNRDYQWANANFVGDSIFASVHLESYKECDYFPQDEVKYIGFKYTNNGTEKLGWVKFILHSYGVFTVLESAIQK